MRERVEEGLSYMLVGYMRVSSADERQSVDLQRDALVGAGVYVCKNTDQPTCDTVSLATLVRVAGIDPFPGLSERLKRDAMALPPPEDSPYAHSGSKRRPRRHEDPSLLGWLLGE